MLFLEFLAFFAFIAIFGYFLPAGQLYFRYRIRLAGKVEPQRIQPRDPASGQVAREIKLSLVTIAIFAAMSTGLFELYKAGKTSIYTHFLRLSRCIICRRVW